MNPRLSIEDIKMQLQQEAESLAEASDNLERLVSELGADDNPIETEVDYHD